MLKTLVSNSKFTIYLLFTYLLLKILVEIVPVKWRAWSGFTLHLTYAFGELVLAGQAYFIRDWRILSISLIWTAIPCVLYFAIPESPTFLFSKGRVESSAQVYQKFGIKNKAGSDLNKIISIFTKIIEQTEKEKASKIENLTKEELDLENKKWTIIDLFKNGRNMSMVSIKISILWLATSVVYYGIGLNTGNIPGSTFMNIAVFAMVDLVSHIVFPLMLENKFLGRTKSIFLGLFLTGLCCLSSTFTLLYTPCQNKIDSGEASGSLNTITLIITFTGRFMIGGNFGAVYQFSGELMPTQVRSNGVALGSTVGKIGTIFTPVILALQIVADWLPGVIFSVLAIGASFVALSMPETRGIPVLNNFTESELLYSGKYREVIRQKKSANGQSNPAME